MSQRHVVPVIAVALALVACAWFFWTHANSPREPGDLNPAALADAGVGRDDARAKLAADELHHEFHKAEVPPPRPLLEGWKEPAAVLVLSGEQHGYIEPCGCSLNQTGGLSRRADLIRQIGERGWPVAALDIGGLVNNPTRQQGKLKLAMTLKCLREMNYAGVALGLEELRAGEELLISTEADRPPFVSSNVVLFGDAAIGPHVPYLIVNVGKTRVGVTAVFGESLKHKALAGLQPQPGQTPDVQILDPAESLAKVLAELEKEQPDLLVLLSHSRLDETGKLAERFPRFDLVVSAGGPEDQDPRPKHLGRALLVTPGQKGKSVGVVGFFPDAKDQRLKFEQVTLDEQRFHDSPAIQEQMREYQAALQSQELVAREAPIDSPWNSKLDKPNDYVGAKICGECHARAYEKWLTTGHARATESIKHGRAGQEATYISRIYDPECVACHVTGWSTDPAILVRYKSGYESEQATPHLVGQQCENCHGPGGRHAELERRAAKGENVKDALEEFRELASISLDQAGVKVCLKCHDGDNDPHFKTEGDVFERYWDEIKHPWRD